ncbi:MAG: sulfatase family protein [Planctomycetota bacterium]|jgi:arylsulfatase A-like enzyme
MKRRDFLKTASLAIGSAVLPKLGQARNISKKPNLVFIFADQLRADTLGYAGDKKAITPNIDRFASESVNFTNAVSVMPVCAAYRASLLSGKYPTGHGMVINELNMNPNQRTIAHCLVDAGYNTGYVGKWHLNDAHKRPTPKGPERMGFDGFWAAYGFNHKSYSSYYFTDGPDEQLKRVSLQGKHGPTEFTSVAMDYIGKAAKQEKPFALFLSWNPPHDPWSKNNVPQENYERFKDIRFELPENFKSTPDPYMDRYPSYAFNGTEEWKKAFIAGGLEECLRCYYAMINNLDEQFGRIMEQLDKLGIADNTIVVFTSDHGEMFGSQGRMYKLTFYDEAARIPLLIRYSKAVKNGVSDICINTPDIMPTLLGLMSSSVNIPQEVEGKDLSCVLWGEKGTEPEAAFLQGMGHTYKWRDGYEWRAVRDKRFTYARYLRDGRELLFDRQKDPYMKSDVIRDSSYTNDLNRLRNCMTKKMKDLKDEFHKCSWYRDNWTYKNYSVKSCAKGEFGPLRPIEPERK